MRNTFNSSRWFITTLVLVPLAASSVACGGSSETGNDSGPADSSVTSGSGGTQSTSSTAGDSTTGASTGDASATADSTGSGGSTSGTSTSAGDSTSTASSTDGTVLDPIELCGGDCACGNGIDDDGDGAIDGFDTECTGIVDNDEGSFATGISGDNKDPKWQDCFFDGNSGAGDDDCRYHTDCLTGALPPNDPDCTVTDTCIDFCTARTPNGCDCFGCCTFDTADGPLSVQIGIACDYENIDDEVACPRCTPSSECGNECGECELCPGKEVLPETCENDVPVCDNGNQVCDAETACPGGYWCYMGCCIIQPVE